MKKLFSQTLRWNLVRGVGLDTYPARDILYCRRIKKWDVKNALRIMRMGKLVGPDDKEIEVWKCMRGSLIVWLTTLLNNMLKREKCQMTGEK